MGSIPFWKLTLNIYNRNSQDRAETDSGLPYLDAEKFDELKREKDSIEKIYVKKIDAWKQKIKSVKIILLK